MLDQNYGGMHEAFLNYWIALSKHGFPVLPVVRNEYVVENKLREAGTSSIEIINNRIGFYDPFAIGQIGETLDIFRSLSLAPYRTGIRLLRHFVCEGRLESQLRRWPLRAVTSQ